MPSTRFDETHAGGRVVPMQRDQREQPRKAVRHRAVVVAQAAQASFGIEPRMIRDRRHRVIHQRVEQVLLAREMVIDAHRLDAEALAQLARRKAREARVVDQRQRGQDDALARQRRPGRAACRRAGQRRSACSHGVVLEGEFSGGSALDILHRKVTLGRDLTV
jgi:hypothetical protein